MKKLALILVFCLLVGLFAGCNVNITVQTDEPETTEAPIESTAATTEATEATTEATTEPAVTGPQVLDLVGTWEFSHTLVEGETVTDGNATVTVTGEFIDTLKITYVDHDFPDETFRDKALSLRNEAVYTDCPNGEWCMDVDHIGQIGDTRYTVTLLPDDMLLMQFSFTVDGAPMVSYRFFTRSN